MLDPLTANILSMTKSVNMINTQSYVNYLLAAVAIERLSKPLNTKAHIAQNIEEGGLQTIFF